MIDPGFLPDAVPADPPASSVTPGMVALAIAVCSAPAFALGGMVALIAERLL